MSTVDFPRITLGDSLTGSMTFAPPTDVVSAVSGSLTAANFGNESFGVRNINFNTAKPASFFHYNDYILNTTKVYNNDGGTWSGIDHGTFDTSNLNAPNGLTEGPAFIIGRLRFFVEDVTLTQADIANDYYYARWGFDHVSGSMTGSPFGFSLCIHNTSGTFTTDRPLILSASSVDVKNPIQGIWRDITSGYYIPSGSSYEITNFRWEIMLGTGSHSIEIGRYATMHDIWRR